MKGPAFTLTGTTIIENKTGYTATVTKVGTSYNVILTHGPVEDKKAKALADRMRSWYYFTQVKP